MTQQKSCDLYELDFHGWLQRQKQLLIEGKLGELDMINLIEELDSLGKQERRELENRLGILLGHLLKWYYQPDLRTKSWWGSIREQRDEIKLHLKRNPSLKPYLFEAVSIGYQKGLRLIDKETPLISDNLPQLCEFTEYQIFAETLECPPPNDGK
ncbi:hypothetical protein GlitD10_1634 [Gloeomargarita lithophora Alchichica-D10]|uniref:DUF29 domain-containing protein n=1 Tax=Gloeomargarita lithophora Alchichica-D10 TaxID=1188229 RepID=A0A1J0ADD4_9CYAN|nr:DUF29 domain-containing protein [Gloeomargarita lithophora]APB33958.1 hypothetical protein GlitD10_1634 [Gloeomargarita lithophora Alchichica-D10]